MKIGFLGASTVARTLATHFIRAGYEVILSNSRGPDSLSQICTELGSNAQAGTVDEAAAADIVVLAVPWVQVHVLLSGRASWERRILVDATNIFLSYAPDFRVADLGVDSGSEIVARLAPDARIVKAFNTLPIQQFFEGAPRGNGRRVLFVAGDDVDAKNTVAGLGEAIGLAAIDLGSLKYGGRLMQLGGALSAVKLIRES